MINNLFKSLIVQIAKIRLQLVKYQTYRVAIFAQIQKLRTVWLESVSVALTGRYLWKEKKDKWVGLRKDELSSGQLVG